MLLKYTLSWLGMMVLAIINGALRDLVYRPYVGDLPAHQISTIILIILLVVYLWVLTRIWPIKSGKQAWTIGFLWFSLTEVFEFAMGLASGDSWSRLLHAYNIFAGQVWIFIPVWVLVGPYFFFRCVRSPKAD